LNCICVFEQEAAHRLESLGFRYRKQKLQGETVYVFMENPSLNKAISELCEEEDFYISRNFNF